MVQIIFFHCMYQTLFVSATTRDVDTSATAVRLAAQWSKLVAFLLTTFFCFSSFPVVYSVILNTQPIAYVEVAVRSQCI